MQIDFAFLADSAAQQLDGRVDALAIRPFTATHDQSPAWVLHFAVAARVGFAPEGRDQSGTLGWVRQAFRCDHPITGR